MLEAHDASNVLDKPPRDLGRTGAYLPSDSDDKPITERPGTVIGPYKLMEQIGEGGMGLVFVAEQQQPVRRKVALKVVCDTQKLPPRRRLELFVQVCQAVQHAHQKGVIPAWARPTA
jgi:serine/threonine protein kinase